MTAQPFDFHHRYTVAEFAALPEDSSARYELQEGSLVVSPRPSKDHQDVAQELFVQLRHQLPRHLKAFIEVDVDLQLPSPVVRIPDVVVMTRAASKARGLTAASDVRIAVEILSPGSVHTDTKIKPLEYAEAGIPQLWLLDPHSPATATILTLVDGEYEESQRAEHSFSVTEPCPLTIDLDSLLD